MTEYVKGIASDRDAIVDFANYVFSQAHRPHDFKMLLGKVYNDEQDPAWMAGFHYLAKTDGKIRGLIACPVIPMKYADCMLKVGLVGTVSTHPYARGEGHMKRLMAMLLQEQKAMGTDLLVLGGQHQRYQHFGFEQAGCRFQFALTEASIRKSWGEPDPEVDLAEIGPEDPLLDAAHALFAAQPAGGIRERERLYWILCSWAMRPFAILRRGQMIGYVCLGTDGRIGEMILYREEDLPDAVKAIARKLGSGITLPVEMYETERIEKLLPECENYSLRFEEMIHVFNWKNVLKACLAIRALYTKMPDADVVLSLDGQVLELSIHEGKVSVEGSDLVPQIVLEGLNAIRTVFDPSMGIVNTMNPLPGIFPLPLVVSAVDAF